MAKKHSKRSREELHQEEASAKHSSLVATSTKKFRREAKVVKAHECQKIVRKIKTLRATVIDSQEIPEKDPATIADEQDSKITRKLQDLNEKLRYTKGFDVEEIAQICMHRVGLQMNENKKLRTDLVEGSDQKDDTENDAKKMFKKKLIETMLRHKRLSSAIQSVSEKVSEYNSWLSKREEWLSGRGQRKSPRYQNENYAEMKSGTKRGREVEYSGSSNLFIGSLNDSAIPQEEEETEEYDGIGHGMRNNYEQFPVEKKRKKNRQGQRARKIKAMAIEARKAGRVWDPSINWREKKAKPKDSEETKKTESASGLDKTKEINAADVANMGKSWKEEGKAHPSWAAREAQKAKSGIAAFAGKKITFD